MPRRQRLPWGLLAAMLLLPACRPGDAPKDPTQPNDDDPKVSTAPASGGIGIAYARRAQAIAKL